LFFEEQRQSTDREFLHRCFFVQRKFVNAPPLVASQSQISRHAICLLLRSSRWCDQIFRQTSLASPAPAESSLPPHAQIPVVTLPGRLFERIKAASSVCSRRYVRKFFRARRNAKLSCDLASQRGQLIRGGATLAFSDAGTFSKCSSEWPAFADRDRCDGQTQRYGVTARLCDFRCTSRACVQDDEPFAIGGLDDPHALLQGFQVDR